MTSFLHLDALRERLPDHAVSAPSVSRWSVGRHLEHCALAITSVVEQLEASRPPAPSAGFHAVRTAVMLTGRIPRGAADAPPGVVPEDGPDEAHTRALLDRAEAAAERARALDPGTWFRHFVLGVLDRDRALRFLAIHDAHHLRIVRDILAAP